VQPDVDSVVGHGSRSVQKPIAEHRRSMSCHILSGVVSRKSVEHPPHSCHSAMELARPLGTADANADAGIWPD